MRVRRRVLPLVVAALAVLAIPSSAHAIGLTNLSAAPVDDQAGAHSNFNIHMEFTGGQVRDLTVGLPPGMSGDPTATPKCTVAQLNAASCPANTVVGGVEAVANILSLPLPITVTGSLFNLVEQAGEPARFGIVLNPPVGDPIILQSAVQLRQTDFGLNTIIVNIPNSTVLSGDTTIVSQDITLYGIAPGTGRPFARNPTSCTPKTTTFSAVPYSGATGTGQASFLPTGCDQLDFSPTFSARAGAPGLTAQGSLVPVTTVIEQDVGEAGLLTASVLTPTDFGANFAELSDSCPLADFETDSCSPSTQVGSALATSPLLTAPLTGPVRLLADPGGGLPSIGLDLKGPLALKLTGSLAIDNRVTFDGLPDIPIGHFELRFTGGPGGLLFANRDLCQAPPPNFTGTFTSHAGPPTVPFAQAATIEGCGPSSKKAANKCKAKKKRKKGKKSEATTSAKKKAKKKCKRKKKKKR